MLVDNVLTIVPTVLIAILTAWSIVLHARKKYPNLIFVTSLVFLTASFCIYSSSSSQFKITLFSEPQIITKVAFSPKQGATELVVKTIQSANKYIYVAAYSFTSKPIADALIDAHKKGVDIKIIHDDSQKNIRGNLLAYLKQSDIPIRINSKYKYMHNKFMIVDGVTIQLGSFNYTDNAERRNAENVLVINNDTSLASSYLNQWQKLWLESQDPK
jgi:phosphatidylserine/phosphatidylglycerophosphate/cardiolipin synthase-like enzyme